MRSEMTIAEAEAWEAARDACIAEIARLARGIRKAVEGEDGPSAHVSRSNAATLDLGADRLRTLRPSVPTGLESRG